jgi:hypothetical protein
MTDFRLYSGGRLTKFRRPPRQPPTPAGRMQKRESRAQRIPPSFFPQRQENPLRVKSAWDLARGRRGFE